MSAPPDRLAEICAAKRAHVAARKAVIRRAEIERMAAAALPPRGFADALAAHAAGGFALIAEVKRASPSKGLIRADFDPSAHARAYAAGGAACLSILTDEPYFQGSDDHLVAARAEVDLPCLRKDFIVDPWQVAESRALGADAVLLIVAALDDAAAREIAATANEHGLDLLVEVHDEAELDRALGLHARLIGINNRNLKNFTVDLATTERLAARLPAGVLAVAESGIASHADLVRLAGHGVRCALVGESLMLQPDLAAATRALLGG